MKNKKDRGFTEGLSAFFASVKLTLVLLIALAATSIIGTVIPQNEDASAYFQRYGEVFYKIFKFLDIFDMYHSWWFQFLLLMLTINLVVCSFRRLPGVWKIVSVKAPKFSRKRFENIKNKDTFSVPSSPDIIKPLFESYIAKRLRRCNAEETDNGFVLYAEKGRWTRMGVYSVHLSIIILFAGAIAGSMFGFTGWVNIPEGETVDHIRLRDNNKPHKLDFSLRCNKFEATFYDSGKPKDYRSSLTVIENGKETLTRSIVVNDPLRYKGVSFYQSSYGTLPPDRAMVKLTEQKTGKVRKLDAPFRERISLPDKKGYLELVQFVSNFRNLGPGFQVRLSDDEKPPALFWLFEKFPTFDQMRKGRYLFSIESYPERHYTGLQVTADPGVWYVYSACMLLIVGIIVTFFMSHNRLFLEVVRNKGGSRVVIGGAANRNRLAFEEKVKKMRDDLLSLSPYTKGKERG